MDYNLVGVRGHKGGESWVRMHKNGRYLCLGNNNPVIFPPPCIDELKFK